MAAKRRSKTKADELIGHLRARGLAMYPETTLKSPWPGHLDLAVADKTYAYLSCEGDPFSVGFKLPESSGFALSIAGTQPTPYGLGKSGWVSMSVENGAELPPVELLEEWLDESYRAQAPKRCLQELDGQPAPGPRSKRAGKAPTSKTASKPSKARKAKSR